MKNYSGFTMIEILLASTILAMVSTPFLLSFSNLGFSYRNLRYSYYAQLIAQKHIETFTNVIQGKNGDTSPYSNYFCNQIKLIKDSKEITCPSLMENITDRIYLKPISDNKYEYSNSSIETIEEIDGLNFTYQIIINPICRRLNDPKHNLEPPGNGIKCDDTTQYQDLNSLEATIITAWDPPGPLSTAKYQISTMFTEFIQVSP